MEFSQTIAISSPKDFYHDSSNNEEIFVTFFLLPACMPILVSSKYVLSCSKFQCSVVKLRYLRVLAWMMIGGGGGEKKKIFWISWQILT